MNKLILIMTCSLLFGVDLSFADEPPKAEKATASEVAVPEDNHRDTGKGVQLTKEQKQKLEARRAAHRKQREDMVQKIKKAPPSEKAKARDSLAKETQNRDNEFHPTASAPDDRRKENRAAVAKEKTKVAKVDDPK